MKLLFYTDAEWKAQPKTYLGFTEDTSHLRDADFSIPHHDFDINCYQKWITHNSHCKFIQRNPKGTSHYSTIKTDNQAKLIPLIVGGTRFRSLCFTLPPCPTRLSYHTSFQKERSTHKPANGLSANCGIIVGINLLQLKNVCVLSSQLQDHHCWKIFSKTHFDACFIHSDSLPLNILFFSTAG